MLAAERRRVISERVRATGQVVVSSLSVEFQVSEETIRRDLEWLEKEGVATRIYGGAVLNGGNHIAPPYSIRKNTGIEQKVTIAQLFSRYIQDGDILMADESSTAAYAIRAIRHLKNITLITNSLELLREVTGQETWHVISTGGTLKNEVMAHIGPHALRAVESYHAKYAIVSCRGINAQLGLADSDDQVVQIKQAMIRACDHTFLLTESRKFDRPGFVALGPISLANTLITDAPPPKPWQERLEQVGVAVEYPQNN